MTRKIKTKSVKSFFEKKFKSKSFQKAYKQVSPLMDIGFAIAEARHTLGMSQSQLAKKLKTTQSVVSRIENGNQNLSVQMLSKIADVLKCELQVQLQPQRPSA